MHARKNRKKKNKNEYALTTIIQGILASSSMKCWPLTMFDPLPAFCGVNAGLPWLLCVNGFESLFRSD